MAVQAIAKAPSISDQAVLMTPGEGSSSQDEKQEYTSSDERPLDTFDDHDV